LNQQIADLKKQAALCRFCAWLSLAPFVAGLGWGLVALADTKSGGMANGLFGAGIVMLFMFLSPAFIILLVICVRNFRKATEYADQIAKLNVNKE
jgi:hypothetical protein